MQINIIFFQYHTQLFIINFNKNQLLFRTLIVKLLIKLST